VKVRVKNKHLIIAVVVFLACTGLVYASGPFYLFDRAEWARNHQDYVTALAHYDALIAKYPDHELVPKALRQTFEMLAGSHVYVRYRQGLSSKTADQPSFNRTLSSGSMMHVEAKGLSLEDRCRMLWAYYTNPGFKDYSWYDVDMILGQLSVIMEERSFAEAEEFYWNGIRTGQWRIVEECARRLVDLYLRWGMFEHAVGVVEYIESTSGFDSDLAELLGNIYFALGDLNNAEAMYAQAHRLMWRTDVGERLNFIREAKGKELHVVEGVVTRSGAPFPGVKVLVYPGPEPVEYMGKEGLRTTDKVLYTTTTDHDGRFVLRLPEGEYDIGIELNRAQMERVDGMQLQVKNSAFNLEAGAQVVEPIEFRFVQPPQLIQPVYEAEYAGGPIYVEWTPYPGAESYSVIAVYYFDKLSSLGISRIGVSRHLADVSEPGVWLDSLTKPLFFLVHSPAGIHPKVLLGMPDLVVLVVEARTESGLTVRSDEVLNVFHRSSGVIHPKQRKLRPEEKLILEYKYEEAYELLQQRLAKNPDDLDALWLLARFYYCGTRPLDESMGGYAHQDLNKCLETLQKIASIEPGSGVAKAIAMVEEQLERSGH